MSKVYLGLGTNLGDKERNLHHATNQIEKQIGKVISQSAFYATAPWGFASSNSFLNAAICVETTLSPMEVLASTQKIEQEMGRTKKSDGGIYTDRIIDIDILLYDDLCISLPYFTVPHPLMHQRDFVMRPLAEIAPDIVHPTLHKTIKEIASSL